MSTLSTFRTEMASRGLLLPAAFVNELNQDAQDAELRALAALAALGRAVDPDLDLADPDALFAILDDAFQLSDSGIFSHGEIFGYFKAARAARLKALAPPELPMPEPFRMEGFDPAAEDAAQAARHEIGDDILDAGLSEDKQAALAELLEAAVQRARAERPERIGTRPEDHREPFPIGLPPTEREPDFNLLPGAKD